MKTTFTVCQSIGNKAVPVVSFDSRVSADRYIEDNKKPHTPAYIIRTETVWESYEEYKTNKIRKDALKAIDGLYSDEQRKIEAYIELLKAEALTK